MKNHPWFILGLAGSALLFSGCGQPDEAASGHEYAEGEVDRPKAGVTFKPDHGLQLSPAVVQALGLRTVAAEERPFVAERTVTAQVFALRPQILATARVVPAQADSLEGATFAAARLVRIDRSTVTATQLVDVVFALDAATPRQIGDFVAISLTAQAVNTLTIPRSALLDGATGTFVYVVNQGAYRRLPVAVGAQAAGFVEITAGLQAGDIVVATPVKQLWLAELRLTKGGGHSH